MIVSIDYVIFFYNEIFLLFLVGIKYLNNLVMFKLLMVDVIRIVVILLVLVEFLVVFVLMKFMILYIK